MLELAAGSTYSPIATTTISGTSTNSYAFTSIASTYTDLVLVINSSKTSGTISNSYVRFNSDSASNYSDTFMYGYSGSASSARDTSAPWILIGDPTTNQSTTIVNIMNYSNATTYKTLVSRHSDGNEIVMAIVGMWRSTTAINRVEVFFTAGTYFSSGSTLTLYGIASA